MIPLTINRNPTVTQASDSIKVGLCPFSPQFPYPCGRDTCQNCPIMMEERAKANLESQGICPVCGADLEVWKETGLGEHLHFEGERNE